MTYLGETYRNIHQLIKENHSYRKISTKLSINKNTIQALVRRLNDTGSIYPSNMKINVYDPYFMDIMDRITYYTSIKKESYKKNHLIHLRRDEIWKCIKKEFQTLSNNNFNHLYNMIKNKQKEGFLSIYYEASHILYFDWGYLTMHVKDRNQKVYFAVFCLPYSYAQICFVALSESAETFHTVFQNYLKQIPGISKALVIDNMKIAK